MSNSVETNNGRNYSGFNSVQLGKNWLVMEKVTRWQEFCGKNNCNRKISKNNRFVCYPKFKAKIFIKQKNQNIWASKNGSTKQTVKWPLNEPAKTSTAVFALWTRPINFPSCQNAYRLYSAPLNKLSGFRHTLHSATKRMWKCYT